MDPTLPPADLTVPLPDLPQSTPLDEDVHEDHEIVVVEPNAQCFRSQI